MSKNVFCTHAYLERWPSYLAIIGRSAFKFCCGVSDFGLPFWNEVEPDDEEDGVTNEAKNQCPDQHLHDGGRVDPSLGHPAPS